MKKHIIGTVIMVFFAAAACVTAGMFGGGECPVGTADIASGTIDSSDIQSAYFSLKCTDNVEITIVEMPIIIAAKRDNKLSEQYDYCSLSNVEKLSDGNMNGTEVTYFSSDVTYDGDRNSCDDILGMLSDENGIVTVEKDIDMYSDAVPTQITDPYIKEEWHLETIGADKVWSVLESNGKKPGEGVVVAVIDTGVDYNHGELKNSMWVNTSEFTGRSGVDDDKNGVIDDIYGANYSGENTSSGVNGIIRRSSDGNPMDTDPDGHGTHVAGIIAMAAHNGGGVGIAYGAKIMAVKAGDSEGYFKVSNVMKAINYAVDMKADVINMSFGTYGESAIIKSVLQEASKNTVIVAACGNDGYPNSESTLENASSVYPAAYPFVIGVMASDTENKVTDWSNYDGRPYTDNEYELAAPGYKILSTIPDNKYAYMSGTSMAAPVVSAAAAILLSEGSFPENTTPAKYVFGQLTHSGGQTAAKTESNGNKMTFPLLNIYDSLNEEQEVNIEFTQLAYYDYTNKTPITDKNYTAYGDTEITIDCGFFIKNTWAEASDVTVSVVIDNVNCELEDDYDIGIGQMTTGAYFDISYDKEEAFRFILKGEEKKTYDIPIKYTIKWNGGQKEVEDKLTITLAGAAATPAPSPTAAPAKASAAENSTPMPAKPAKVKGLKYKGKKIKWKKAKGAVNYYVYYSYKKKSGFKKLGITARTFYQFKRKKKPVYIKVRAAVTATSGKLYGRYSSTLKIKKK